VLLGAHVLAALGAAVALPGAAGLGLAALLAGLGLAAAWDRAVLRGPSAPRTLELRGDGASCLRLRDGSALRVHAGSRIVHRHWAIVAVEHPARRRLLVASDMLAAEEFRWLRLWILWGKLPVGVASVA